MLTLSLKREMRKARGNIIPCQSPSQKPARSPPELGESFRTFGPAAQPVKTQATSSRANPQTHAFHFISCFLQWWRFYRSLPDTLARIVPVREGCAALPNHFGRAFTSDRNTPCTIAHSCSPYTLEAPYRAARPNERVSCRTRTGGVAQPPKKTFCLS